MISLFQVHIFHWKGCIWSEVFIHLAFLYSKYIDMLGWISCVKFFPSMEDSHKGKLLSNRSRNSSSSSTQSNSSCSSSGRSASINHSQASLLQSGAYDTSRGSENEHLLRSKKKRTPVSYIGIVFYYKSPVTKNRIFYLFWILFTCIIVYIV